MIKHTIFITGDTHGDVDRFKLRDKIRKNKLLTRDDFLIIAGDWGVFWGPGEKNDQDEKRLLKWYGGFPCTVLIVDGNHDNHIKLNALPTEERWGNDVGVIRDNIFHLRRGRVYTLQAQKFFIFGGADSIDKSWRTIGIDWWPEELPTKEQIDRAYEELDKHDWTVDYVVTHTGPLKIIKHMGFQNNYEKYCDPTCQFLNIIDNQLLYKKWFFGHMHVDEEFVDGKYRTIYNGIVDLAN